MNKNRRPMQWLVAAIGLSLAACTGAALSPTIESDAAASEVASTVPTESVPEETESEPMSLLDPGDIETIDAVDPGGTWGSITIQRGMEVGGYRHVSNHDLDLDATDARSMFFQNDPGAFYLELLVTYRADRTPATVGSHEWRLVIASSGESLEPITRGGIQNDLGPEMPGANIDGGPYEAELVFAVPRSASGEVMILRYAPVGETVAELTVRTSGAPPEPIMTIIPPVSPSRDYIEQDGSTITVIASQAADALFATPDTCENPELGYQLTFPDDWWTNTEIGDVPACSWFSPTAFEVADPLVIPEEIVIVMSVIGPTDGIGTGGQALPVASIDTVGARPAYRVEHVGVGGGFFPWGTHVYRYYLGIDGALPGDNNLRRAMVAGTDWQLDDDPAAYTLHKAILDRIMASLEFTDEE